MGGKVTEINSKRITKMLTLWLTVRISPKRVTKKLNHRKGTNRRRLIQRLTEINLLRDSLILDWLSDIPFYPLVQCPPTEYCALHWTELHSSSLQDYRLQDYTLQDYTLHCTLLHRTVLNWVPPTLTHWSVSHSQRLAYCTCLLLVNKSPIGTV